MAYSGTTAATSAANPPIQIARGVGASVNTTSTGGAGTGLWFYASTEGSSLVGAANYFSDAYYMGMRQGDVMIVTGATGSSAYIQVALIGAVTTAGAGFASTGAWLSSTR